MINLEIKINNLKINYIDTLEKSEEKVCVILHGWGSNIDLHSYMINALQNNMRVIALDMPGFGKSEEPGKAMNVEDYSRFVAEFLKALDVKSASFIGHSFGGRIIIKINELSLFPMQKAVLIDAAGIKPKKKLSTIIRIKFFKLATKFFQIPIIDKMYPGYIDNMRKKMGSADYAAASPIMRASLVQVVNEDLTEHLSKIKSPALLIWGENDEDTPLKDGQLMNKLIPDSRLVIIKNAGHFSFLDEIETVNSEILNFLI